jgi:hypothetical protein
MPAVTRFSCSQHVVHQAHILNPLLLALLRLEICPIECHARLDIDQVGAELGAERTLKQDHGSAIRGLRRRELPISGVVECCIDELACKEAMA